MQKRSLLPNLITLANAFCGLLALAKGLDALMLAPSQPALFYTKLESACFLVFLAMVFDALDGFVARLMGSSSDFGAQLDSFADALTFGVAPALLAKILIEHEATLYGLSFSPRLVFLAAAVYSMMAILRLVRFNLENEHDAEAHQSFSGLPSPAAAGAVVSLLWLYLVLRRPELEISEGAPTPLGGLMGWLESAIDWRPLLAWVPPLLLLLLPVVGLLMVSRLRFPHVVSRLAREKNSFPVLVLSVLGFVLFYLAPVPILSLAFHGFVLFGLLSQFWRWRAPSTRPPATP